MVIHRKSAPYHPQANGQVESTNKTLCTTLTKVVEGTRTADWDQKLHSVLWAYRTAYKTAIGTTPFNLVFGFECNSSNRVLDTNSTRCKANGVDEP